MMPSPENANARGQAGEGTKQNSYGAGNHTSNSSCAQRARIIDHLRRYASLTTLEARKKLDVLHPAMRILELRSEGHQINTAWVYQATDCGKVHRVARYDLILAQPDLFGMNGGAA